MTETYEYKKHADDLLYFDLDFGGQVENSNKEVVKRSDSQHKFPILTSLIRIGKGKKVDNKEVKRSNSADKFSTFAKLAIMKTDGSEYVSSCKLFCFHSANS